jgi:hypothetical protein
VDKRLTHQGDPCRFCGTLHDQVKIGPCPAFLEVRCPKKGEFFLSSEGVKKEALFDFTEQVFPIFR